MQLTDLLMLLAFGFVLAEIEVNNHVRRIYKNGTRNNLKYTFHRHAATWRLVFIAIFGALFFGNTFYQTGRILAAGFGWYFYYSLAVFWLWFNPRLSLRRLEITPDYPLSKFYVSREPNAAFLDRALVWFAWLLNEIIFRLKFLPAWYVTPEALNKRFYFLVMASAITSAIYLADHSGALAAFIKK